MRAIVHILLRAFGVAGPALLLALLGACATTQAPVRAYQTEAFTLDSPFQYYSSRDPDGVCEIGKRALLSQGYQLENTQQTTSIRGEKYFQPATDRANKLSITLICLPSSLGAVMYASALETVFELKARSNNAGVSVVSGFGSLSLPWAIDKDSLVKVGEATVIEAEFYQRLFDLIKTLDG